MSDHSITSLIEKLEGASEGSVELDALIYSHLNCTLIPRRAEYRPRRRWPNGSVTHQRKVTTSLDAALALAGRVLGEESALSMLQDTVDGWNAAAGLSIRNLPRLLCAAILRAQSEAR